MLALLVCLRAAITFVLLLGVSEAADDSDQARVLFREDGAAAAPCAYGHLTFTLRKHLLRAKFVDTAELVLQHFVEHRLSHDTPPPEKFQLRLCGGRTKIPCGPLHDLPKNASLDHTYVAELHGLVESVHRVTDEMLEMIFGRGGTRRGSRDKRFVALLALGLFEVFSFGLTIKNSLDIATFNTRLSSLEARMDAIIHLDDEIVKTQVRDHHMIERLINVTNSIEERMVADRRASVFIAYRTVLEGVLAEAKETYQALGVLHQGIVSTSLLNFTQLETAYEEFGVIARRKGLSVAFKRPSVLLGAHAAFWTEGDLLRFALPVPLVSAGSKDLLRVYRLETEPTTVPSAGGLQILYTAPHSHILVSSDRTSYFPLSLEEWTRCNNFGDVTFCPDVRLRRDSFASTCIGALFADLPEKNVRCGVKIRRAPALEVREMSVGAIAVVSTTNRTAQWRIKCQGVNHENFTLARRGVVVIRVPEGCMAYGEEHAYTNLPRTIVFDTVIQPVVQSSVGLPAVLAAFADWQQVLDVYNATIGAAEAHEYHEASVLADALAAKRIASLESHAQTVGTYGLGSGVGIVVVVLLVGATLSCVACRHKRGFGKLRVDDHARMVRMSELERRTEEAERRVVEERERIERVERMTAEIPGVMELWETRAREQWRAELPSLLEQRQQQAAQAAAATGGRRKKTGSQAGGGSVDNLLG